MGNTLLACFPSCSRAKGAAYDSPLDGVAASGRRSAYFPLHALRGRGCAAFSAEPAPAKAGGAGIGAETALPCSAANSRALAKLGAAGVILTFLRVLHLVDDGTFLTARQCLGLRFQPFRVQCQPSFESPPFVMRL